MSILKLLLLGVILCQGVGVSVRRGLSLLSRAIALTSVGGRRYGVEILSSTGTYETGPVDLIAEDFRLLPEFTRMPALAGPAQLGLRRANAFPA